MLLPASGEGAAIGQSARAAIRVAVGLANGDGGVNGQQVKLFFRDEGADTATAAESLQQLLDDQVDVIIGPASSNIAEVLVPTMVSAGVAACSPSASALALDDFPDGHLFFRTIPSDSLQAEAMAKVIEQTGETSASIAYIDDGYGRPFATRLQAALRRRGINIADSVGFAVDDDAFATEADRLVASGPGAIALIGDPDAGSRMLAALAEAIGAGPRDVVVNDSLRRPWSLSLLASVNDAEREHIVGVSQSVLTDDQDLLQQVTGADPTATGLFATQAYDCANLFMLAAEQAGSTQPAVIASLIPDISTAGSRCLTFVQCNALLGDHRNINYEGPDGSLALGSNGDPESASFDQFDFDDAGRDVTLPNSISVAYPGS